MYFTTVKCYKQNCYFFPAKNSSRVKTVPLLNFDEFDAEIQLFSGHLMIGVQSDIDIIFRSDGDRERLAVHVAQIYALADIEILGAGKLSDRDGNDPVRFGHAVGFFGHQVDIDSLTDFHVGDSLVKSGDHHACATDELQRLAAIIGGVELCAVVEGPSVMHFYVFAGIFAVQDNLGGTAAAASAAAASASFFTFFMMAAASILITVTVMAALMAFSMTVMVTVGAGGDKLAAQI